MLVGRRRGVDRTSLSCRWTKRGAEFSSMG
jgi:hypothetical protein